MDLLGGCFVRGLCVPASSCQSNDELSLSKNAACAAKEKAGPKARQNDPNDSNDYLTNNISR